MRSSLLAALAAPLCARAAALAVALTLDPRDMASPDTPWVSVDASGTPHTVTPSVTRVNGAASTVSGPPAQLTSTAEYTLTVSGTPTTVTGQPPVASATGASGSPEGVFITCDKYVGQDKPFCLPQRGSALYPGRTYYITWNPSYFANDRTVMDIDIVYDNGQGVTFPNLAASQGFYAWKLDSDFLSKQGVSQMTNVSIGLSFFERPGDNASDMQVAGPQVFIVPAPAGAGGSSGPGTAAIIVIVIVVVAVLLIAAVLVWSWRARGHPFALCMGGLKRRSTGGGGQGYGVRKSHAERTGGLDVGGAGGDPDSKARGVGIQLTDRDSWSPTQGRNVFREEVQRQENER